MVRAWARFGVLAAVLAVLAAWAAPAARGLALDNPPVEASPGAAPLLPRVALRISAQENVDASLEPVRPEVEWSEAGLTSWRSVPSRQGVKAGDRVRTGAGASARLVYFEGSVIELAANTGILVQRLERSPSGDLISSLFVAVGSVLSRVVPMNGTEGSFQFETPAAVGRARGTTPRVEVTGNGMSLIGNLPDNTGGLVNVEGKDPAATQVTLQPGYQTLVRPGEPPSEPFSITSTFRIRYCQTAVCLP